MGTNKINNMQNEDSASNINSNIRSSSNSDEANTSTRAVMNTTTTTTTSSATATITITETATLTDDMYTLHLQPRQRVTWNENVVNNEGLGRKSSKRCCIFHKQRGFGESSSSSESESSSSSSSEDENDNNDGQDVNRIIKKKYKRIARKKKIPDYQRYHA